MYLGSEILVHQASFMHEFYIYFFSSLHTNVVLLMVLFLLGRMESQEKDYFWKRQMHIRVCGFLKAMHFCTLILLVVSVCIKSLHSL